ncbi:hypothetical protein [Sulfitobacter dubius]|uniref:hypothetical protein n=1 Tax=Sulfitobacter dubius TaxID=218673 RepID=UPI0008F29D7A|nr:hypothetical protein [Sulfitobacter dubius]SFG54696.1 hypothetical protein SAMN04488039_1011194 [Sulfitobacter dubius]
MSEVDYPLSFIFDLRFGSVLLDVALRRSFAFRELMPGLSDLSEYVGGVGRQKLLAPVSARSF